MDTEVSLNCPYVPSQDVVARDIMGELIIVPLASGIGDMEDDIYTLKDTGWEIWEMLDGRRLSDVADALKADYKAPPGKIEEDVVGLVGELFKRKIVVRT
jgi:hypothetical protein